MRSELVVVRCAWYGTLGMGAFAAMSAVTLAVVQEVCRVLWTWLDDAHPPSAVLAPLQLISLGATTMPVPGWCRCVVDGCVALVVWSVAFMVLWVVRVTVRVKGGHLCSTRAQVIGSLVFVIASVSLSHFSHVFVPRHPLADASTFAWVDLFVRRHVTQANDSVLVDAAGYQGVAFLSGRMYVVHYSIVGAIQSAPACAAAFVAMYVFGRRRDLQYPPLCEFCGYSLRGGGDRCPECGSASTRGRAQAPLSVRRQCPPGGARTDPDDNADGL